MALAMPRFPAPATPQVLPPTQAPVPVPSATPQPAVHIEHSSEVEFEYIGAGRLTVTGPITGTVYYFSVNRETISVNSADAPLLVSIPGLKIVS